MSLPSLIIGGVTLPRHAFLNISQEYRAVESVARHRMGSGALVQQMHWRKLATSIQASGWIPPALAGIDWDGTVSIACIAPRSVQGTTATLTLPAARRTDFAPYGYAIVNGILVPTTISIATNTASLGTVSGATGYAVYYYPLLTCYASAPREQLDINSAVYGWALEAEEV